MSKFTLFGYETDIDQAATADWYAAAVPWGCTCGHCRNFIALALEKKLPPPVLLLLDRLHIPPEKATYVCQIYPDGDGHFYQFSYRIAGKILNAGPEENQSFDWGEGRCCHETYPYGAPGFPDPHFDLEFWVSLPQIL